MLYTEAIAIFRRHFGPDDLEIGINYNNLGAIRFYQGDYNSAEIHYRHSLRIKEHHLGSDHPDVGLTLSNLATLYEHLDRLHKAVSLYPRALAIFTSTLGVQHPHAEACREALDALTAAALTG